MAITYPPQPNPLNRTPKQPNPTNQPLQFNGIQPISFNQLYK